MKKTIVLLVFSIAMCSSLFAQKNADKKIDQKVSAYVEAVESKLTLTSEEKETLITIKEAQVKASFEINAKYEKGSEELKEKRKESNKEFSKSLNKAFGKDRAKEIKLASRKNKKKK